MLLDTLKQQTRQHHDRLEQLNGLPSDRESYLHLLECFHGYVVPWEETLAARVPADDPLRQGREKSGWLSADLEHFSYTPAQRANLPRCGDLPASDSRAALLGACYVLEGSTLGGQYIVRHLQATLGVRDGEGNRYFRSYGSEVGAKWQAFRQELMQHSSPETDPVIVRSAQATFEKLAAWFGARLRVGAS